MRNKRLFSLFAVILIVIMMSVSFNHVQAEGITSVFTSQTVSRTTISTLANNQTLLSNPMTLQRLDTGYKYDGGTKTIWKFADKNNPEDMYYCLNKDQGFAYATEAQYNYMAELNLDDLNSYSDSSTITWNQAKYNKILWILDNVYIPNNQIDIYEDDSLIALLDKAGIDTQRYNKTYDLIAEDIVTAQRMAIWNVTNGLDVTSSISGIPDLDLQDQFTGDKILSRRSKIIKLYHYFVNNASATYTREEPVLTIENNASITQVGNSYIVGPYTLKGNNLEKVQKINVSATHSYTLLDASKNQVNNNNFMEVMGEKFYLQIPKDQINDTTDIKLTLTYKYDYRTFTFMTNSFDSKNTQPVVIVKAKELSKNLEVLAQIPLINVMVEKVWDDNNNQDNVRPNEIKVQLYKTIDGTETSMGNGYKVTLNEINNWQHTWTNLLDDSYIVKELNEKGNAVKNNEKYNNDYTTKYQIYNNKTIITNTHIPQVVEKTVTKIWSDGNDSDQIRPDGIEVQLYKTVNETKVSMGDEYKVTLNETNNWQYSWSNLPAKQEGKNITYTAQEVEVPTGYEVSYSDDTFTITNTHIPKDLGIQIQKVDEEGKIITESEAIFKIIADNEELTAQTTKGILDLDSQKLLSNNFEFIYTIKETKAPIGYNGLLGELTIKISGTTKLENGSYVIENINITDNDGNNLDETKISAEYNQELNKVIIQIVNTRKTNQYSVKLLKVSEDGTTPVGGAWFKVNNNQAILVSEAGEEIAAGTISNAGELNLTYKLEEETAPNGYIKIEEPKEVKIKAQVEFKEDEYQITKIELLEQLDGVTVTEQDNVITIKVENKIEVTGKYNVKLRKVDENGNILTGSKFNINGKEYSLSTGEVTLLNDIDLASTNDINLTYAIKETEAPEDYEVIEDTTIYLRAKIQRQDNNYKLIRAELVDGEGNLDTYENISVKIEGDTIVIIVKNIPVQKKLDLSLRKFITTVNEIEYSREPIVNTSTISTTGTATYKHTKEPIPVQKGDIVTYTIRVYNEGEVDGYVEQITDYLPENLLPIIDGIEGIDSEKYKDEIEFNSNWLWMYYDDGTTVTTTITSKSNSDTYSLLTGLESVTETKLNAYIQGADKLDYIDVQIKCLVTQEAKSNEYLTNIAEISAMCDEDGLEVITDRDSTKSNVVYSNLGDYRNEEAINSSANSFVKGQEDDDDFEKLVVKEFDLSLRKFITKVNEVLYTRVPVVDTSKLGTIVNGKVVTTATYNHSKLPVIVETDDIVTYTIRIYNEGTLEGFANEITDDIPKGLEFLPDSLVNISYKWKMLDQEGKETQDVSKAVMIITDYLSDVDKDNILNPISDVNGVKTLDYKDIEVQFKVIAKAENLKDNIIINEAQISQDSERDIDSIPNRDEKYDYSLKNNEDDIDYEPIKLQYFDLALRKFITQVNNTQYNNRYPEIWYNGDGSITYSHTKDPVLVTTNDVVIYTIRVYNEGEKAGYATQITDNLPEGLEFIPDNEINKKYGWEIIDSEGNVTEDIAKAAKLSTDYLKNEKIDPLLEESDQKILSYKDVEIAFKVTESNMSNRILVNTAQISNDSDEDVDSIPGNDILTEDDIDKEYVQVQYFDLSLKKWVTETQVTYDGKTTTTKTGFNEDSEEIAKVDLVASKMKKTTVKFKYNIKVTNEGELPGYIYELKDYIPSGLKFVSEDNKDWKEEKDGIVVTEKLKDTLLNPGESAVVEIVLTWKNSTTNLGLKTNYAEISNDSADDIDSVPDNYNKQEDDIDDAQIILSIKTAGTKTYIGLVLLTTAILAGGIFLIKKYVIE